MGTVRRAIKADARAALKGRTGTAAAITFILMLTAFALSLAEAVIPLLLNIPGFLQQAVGAADIWESIRATAPWYLLATGIAALLSLIFTAPLQVGSCDWYMDTTFGEQQDAGHIFWPFGCRRFWGAVVLRVLTALISAFWLVLFLALPAAGLGCALYQLYSFRFEAVAYSLLLAGALAAALLVPVMLVLLGIFLSWLELVPYLMGHRQNMGPFKALRTAARITKGHRFETFVFQLSFLPWMLLNSLVIPALFVLPYRSMAMALYTRYLLELEENASRPVILPADGETPALPGAEQAPAPEAFADAEAEEVAEVVEEVPAEPAEAPAEVQEAQETPEALSEATAEEAPEEPEEKPEPPAEEAPAAYPDLPQSWED